MIVCHCNCISDKDFKEAACSHPKAAEEDSKAAHCRLKKVYTQASSGKKPKCYGCAPLIKKVIA